MNRVQVLLEKEGFWQFSVELYPCPDFFLLLRVYFIYRGPAMMVHSGKIAE